MTTDKHLQQASYNIPFIGATISIVYTHTVILPQRDISLMIEAKKNLVPSLRNHPDQNY